TRARSFFAVFFFFQAEDGIRDFHVTGVQTCALPISANTVITGTAAASVSNRRNRSVAPPEVSSRRARNQSRSAGRPRWSRCAARSEERRVGKECRARGSPEHEKKKNKKGRTVA